MPSPKPTHDPSVVAHRTFDEKIIQAVVRDPNVYEVVTDDGRMPVEQWRPVESTTWIACHYKGQLVGLLALSPVNGTVWNIHVMFKSLTWGTGIPRICAPDLLDAAWEITGAHKFYAMIPITETQVFEFSQYMGFEVEGICPEAWLKNGTYIDSYHLGCVRGTD